MSQKTPKWIALQRRADEISTAIEALVPIARKQDGTAIVARGLRKQLLSQWARLDAQVRELQKRG